MEVTSLEATYTARAFHARTGEARLAKANKPLRLRFAIQKLLQERGAGKRSGARSRHNDEK